MQRDGSQERLEGKRARGQGERWRLDNTSGREGVEVRVKGRRREERKEVNIPVLSSDSVSFHVRERIDFRGIKQKPGPDAHQ